MRRAWIGLVMLAVVATIGVAIQVAALLELGGTDLALDPEETLALVAAMGEPLDATEAQLLSERAEGWAERRTGRRKVIAESAFSMGNDFEVADEAGCVHRGSGEQLADYLCYRLPVLAPADGTVARIAANLAP